MKKHKLYLTPSSQEKGNTGRIVFDEFVINQYRKVDVSVIRLYAANIKLAEKRYNELKILAALERELTNRLAFYSDESLRIASQNEKMYTELITHFFNYLWGSKLFVSINDI